MKVSGLLPSVKYKSFSRSIGVKLEVRLFQFNEPIKVRNVTETEAFKSLKRPNHSVSSYLVFVKDLNGETEERRLRITRTKSTMHSFSLKSLSPGSNSGSYIRLPKTFMWTVHGSLVLKAILFTLNLTRRSLFLIGQPIRLADSVSLSENFAELSKVKEI